MKEKLKSRVKSRIPNILERKRKNNNLNITVHKIGESDSEEEKKEVDNEV